MFTVFISDKDEQILFKILVVIFQFSLYPSFLFNFFNNKKYNKI